MRSSAVPESSTSSRPLRQTISDNHFFTRRRQRVGGGVLDLEAEQVRTTERLIVFDDSVQDALNVTREGRGVSGQGSSKRRRSASVAHSATAGAMGC